jgi:hypothetical protein
MRCRVLALAFLAVLLGFLCIWPALSGPPAALNADIDLLTATVAELQALLAEGTVTSEELLRYYVAHIEANNYRGLELRAVLELAPYEDLIQQARRCDRERRNGRIRGPLHGIPILVKDNLATDPELGMNTTAGSFALRMDLLVRVAECSGVCGSKGCNSCREAAQGGGNYFRQNQS